MERLLKLQRLQPNEDIVLSFFDKRGNASSARLYIQVTQDSMSAIAGTVVGKAQTATQRLSQPLVANLSDAVTNTANAVSNQKNLITSFNCLMNKLDVLVKVGDEVAKIHPYVYFA